MLTCRPLWHLLSAQSFRGTAPWPLMPAPHSDKFQYPLSALSRREALLRRLLAEGGDVKRLSLYAVEALPELSRAFRREIDKEDFARVWESVTRMTGLQELR